MLSCPVKSTFHPRPLTPLVSALTSFPSFSQKIAFLTLLESALTDTPSSNPFRIRSYKNSGGWGSPNLDLPKLCTKAQKRPPVSPFPATLTHSLSRNPFVCHSYANTRDGYATASAKSKPLLQLCAFFGVRRSCLPAAGGPPLLRCAISRRYNRAAYFTFGGFVKLIDGKRVRALLALGVGGFVGCTALWAQGGAAQSSPAGLPSEMPARIEPVTASFDYVRRDVMIPMRDGVRLHTVILVPKGARSVGILGISYDGFLPLMALVNPHPALKVAVPMNPMVDGWMGDDWFHNGAF